MTVDGKWADGITHSLSSFGQKPPAGGFCALFMLSSVVPRQRRRQQQYGRGRQPCALRRCRLRARPRGIQRHVRRHRGRLYPRHGQIHVAVPSGERIARPRGHLRQRQRVAPVDHLGRYIAAAVGLERHPAQLRHHHGGILRPGGKGGHPVL